MKEKMWAIVALSLAERFRFAACLALLPLFAYPSQLTAQILGKLPPLPAISVTCAEDGLIAEIGDENLHVSVCSDSVIHIVASPKPLDSVKTEQPWMLDPKQSCPGAKFQFAKTSDTATLTTATVRVEFSLARGNLKFSNIGGESLLRESDAIPRTYEPAQINGEATYHVTDRFSPDATEGFYGLGQHQSGMFNYRGSAVELGQNNTDVAIPLLLSSRGYALLWNTASFTYADNRFPLDFHFTSLAGESVDYYFIYGPEMDQVVHEYRSMTGHTPMLPKWAYGFFQSKDRYKSQDEILEIAHRYREEHIPLDAIVQDWFWWKTEGDPVFNSNYTDIPAELKTLHDEHVHAMISVWGLFDATSQNFQTIAAQHWDVPNTHVYDASDARARDFYWENLAGKLFSQGWDAFWLDSAEPEEYWPHMGDAILRDKQLAIGSGARYTNIFPFMHTRGIQEHWKATTDQKRVFLLTRSAVYRPATRRGNRMVWRCVQHLLHIYSLAWRVTDQDYTLQGRWSWTGAPIRKHGTSGTSSCLGLPSWSTRCSNRTRPTAPSTCRTPPCGMTFGLERR